MLDLSKPLDLASKAFHANKFEIYEQIREERPVHKAKVSIMTVYTVSRYEDCANLLKDPRVIRNRSTITGGRRYPFPVPRSLKPLAESMIQEDDPNHRRLRDLVRHAFKPQAIATLESRIDAYSRELLDDLAKRETFDLQAEYAQLIPVRMIGDMMGISRQDMPRFQDAIRVLTRGISGPRLVRSMLFDLPGTMRFIRELIQTKRRNPGDDILTGLIEAEEDGDRLTEDELVALVFLLVIAGFETTIHLITNGVITLFEHPESLEQLKADPTLIDTTVEEILRHRGPVQSTKPNYAMDDLTLHGETIPAGQPIMPLFGAANHDPRAFDNPLEFDLARSSNRHLGFGHGIHYCLGAHLARAETRIAINNLLERIPALALAVNPSELRLQRLPGWHRYDGLPVRTEKLRAAA